MAESSRHMSMAKDNIGHLSEVDLTAGQSSYTGPNEVAFSPPSSPPGYIANDAYEMQPVPHSTNRFPASPPAEPPQPPPNDESSFNLNFYKPRTNFRTYLLGMIFLLIVALVILSTVFPIKIANLQKQLRDQPKPRNMTLSTTMSTTLFSTFSMTASTTFSTTASTTLSTTLFSTKSTAITSLSTLSTTESTTISTTASTTLSTTILSMQTTALLQVTSTIVTTQIQPTIILSISTLQTTLPTTTQLSTVTSTSLVPTIQPTSVAVCWKLLSNICSNVTSVPADLTSNVNGFGDCSSIFRFFYCGLIDHLQTIGDMIIPADSSPICGGMLNFCEKEVAGVKGRGVGGWYDEGEGRGCEEWDW